jgi:ribosomal-protein-alanine N-acetyltransferase
MSTIAPIIVRAVTSEDAAALSALNADVQDLHARALPWRFKPPGPDSFAAADVAALLIRPETVMRIAEVDAQPVGYAYAEIIRRPETGSYHAYDLVYLHHLSVRPSHRRQGVGGALLDAVRAAGQSVGIELVALDVWTFNDTARAFFQRHGFSPYNERLWNRPEDP